MISSQTASMLELAQSAWYCFVSLNVTKAFLLSLSISSSAFAGRELVKYISRRWFSSYERNAEDVRELHRKVHDRLCDLYVSIKLNKQQENFDRVKKRLLYNAARLRKHKPTGKDLAEDINELVLSLPDFNIGAKVDANKTVDELGVLVETIRDNLDKLWETKC